MNYRTVLSFFALVVLPVTLLAQETLVEFEDIYPEKLEIAGFTLQNEQSIKISAKAITLYRHRKAMFTNAWILDSATRELMWELYDADDTDNDRYVTTFEDEITLPAGNYEVYYSSYPDYSSMWSNWDGDRWHKNGFLGGLFGEIFYDDDRDIRRRDYRDLNLIITGNGTPKSEDDVFTWQDELKSKAFYEYTAIRDDRHDEKIIKVNKSVSVRIYGIGEARDNGAYDFGWLVDMKNRDKIWQLNWRRSIHAGGASKNRLADEMITLEPGTYKIFYVTDDSHSYRRWNSAPPYDPAFWGVTIWLDKGQDKAAITIMDTEEFEEKNVVVKFDRVRNRDYRVQGFEVKKPLKLHILALGEGRNGEMFDYGWIVDTKSHRRVWEMEYYDTENAGGAHKNRMFDGTITLDPGEYIAYYVSDGSHSYHSWNSGKPFKEQKWGMTISAVDESFTKSDVSLFDETDDASVLVRINRVGDYDRARASFTLDENQKVHIYAIGEGARHEMYDYAWIEDSNTGRVVWEMTYRKTERAGGARKNRLFDDNVYLEAGEYEVFYETDDSHSFADWNASPPHDPVSWGITITRLEK